MDSIAHDLHPEEPEAADAPSSNRFTSDEMIRGVATVGAIGVCVALIEAALIPGMVIGVAAALAPKYVPKIGASMQPFFRSSVRGLYKFNRKTREAVAEAHERVRDIVAEVHTEETRAPLETAPHAGP